MRAEELDKLLKFFFENKSRLVNLASWVAAVGLVVLFIYTGAALLSDAHDDHFKYSDNQCTYKGDDGKLYWRDKGFTPPNNIGHCNATGVLVRSLSDGYHKNADVLKIGIPIVLAPWLLVFLNGGIIGFRVTARRGVTAVKTSALKQALSAHKSRKLTERKLESAEARSIRMERDLEKAQDQLDKLLAS